MSNTGLIMVTCVTYDKKSTTYNNQTSFRHILLNKLHIEFLTCDKHKDIFNIYIYDLHI